VRDTKGSDIANLAKLVPTDVVYDEAEILG
jgi:hypothetical protein